MSKNESRLVTEFEKNSAELIRAHLVFWKKTTYIDIRIWYRDGIGDDGAIKPTTKGLRINAELLPDLSRALTETQRVENFSPGVVH